MRIHRVALPFAAFGLSLVPAFAATPPANAALPVTVENFPLAESDLYFSRIVKDGGFGKFNHSRTPARIDHQTVIRLNRDTLYSSAVFDLEAGPVTVTLPDAGDRFMSMMAVNQDHYVPSVVYGAGRYTYSRRKIDTRYVMLAVRTLVNPSDPADLRQVRGLQDAIVVEQKNGPGKFAVPRWDAVSQKKVRDALLSLASSVHVFDHAFGTADDVDPIRHLLGTAAGWGGNPDKDAVYRGITPKRNNGVIVYRMTVGEVPVDAFWSISVYNAQGYFQPNKFNAYSLNSVTAKRGNDGSVLVQFGGCNGKIANCLPIMPGWNYTVRMYRPRAEILNGEWTFPEATPAR